MPLKTAAVNKHEILSATTSGHFLNYSQNMRATATHRAEYSGAR